VENLTHAMEVEIEKLIAHIDQMGGSVSAIERGFMQEQIASSAYTYQRDIEGEKKIVVGVNKFQSSSNTTPPPFKIDDSIREMQMKKIEALKSKRDNAKVQACLLSIEEASKGNTNLMPLVLEAVEHYCTLGEISETLRKVFGEYRQ
jgi:methylmalonyl-CoA mutase N-terminal domain/subunit